MLRNTNRIITVCQMRATNNKQQNLVLVEKLLKKAKSDNSCFVFLPECCDYMGVDQKNTLELAESLSGQTMKLYKQWAKEYKLWLSIGGFHESQSNKKMYNSHIIIDSNGDIVATYRKLHLFDVDTIEYNFRESKIVEAGQEIMKPLNSIIGPLGLMICYDVRFPELSIMLRKMGAKILTYPSAFSYVTGKAHWETLLRARSIENQCYVIAAAQIGYHNEHRRSFGYAMVIDPCGKVIANCNEEELCAVSVELDLNYTISVRNDLPLYTHRRQDLYNTIMNNGNYLNSTSTKHTFNGINVPEDIIFLLTDHSFAFIVSPVTTSKFAICVTTRRAVKTMDELSYVEIIDFLNSITRCKKLYQYKNKIIIYDIIFNEPQLNCRIIDKYEMNLLDNESEVSNLELGIEEAKQLKFLSNWFLK